MEDRAAHGPVEDSQGQRVSSRDFDRRGVSKTPRRSGDKTNAYELYRRVLKMPHLADAEIDTMRRHMVLLAQTICEHVWGRRFF